MIDLRPYQTRFNGLASALARDRPKYFNKITPQYLANHLNDIFQHMEYNIHVANKTTHNNPANWNKIEFINVALSEPQKNEFKLWAKTHSQSLADDLGQVMVDKYRVSCVWDDGNQCFIATFTGKPEQSTNPERALSSRSDDWYEALALNLYKHHVIFKAGKWNGEITKNNWG